MGKRRKTTSVAIGEGMECPRCGVPTEVREHFTITEKMLRAPFYYSQWNVCKNRECKTTLIMDENFRVYKRGSPEEKVQKEMFEREGFINSL